MWSTRMRDKIVKRIFEVEEIVEKICVKNTFWMNFWAFFTEFYHKKLKNWGIIDVGLILNRKSLSISKISINHLKNLSQMH